MSFDLFWCVIMMFDDFWWFLTIFYDIWWFVIFFDDLWCILMTYDAFWWVMVWLVCSIELYICGQSKMAQLRDPKGRTVDSPFARVKICCVRLPTALKSLFPRFLNIDIYNFRLSFYNSGYHVHNFPESYFLENFNFLVLRLTHIHLVR